MTAKNVNEGQTAADVEVKVEGDIGDIEEATVCSLSIVEGRAKIRCATLADVARAKAALSSPVRVELVSRSEDAGKGDDTTDEETRWCR